MKHVLYFVVGLLVLPFAAVVGLLAFVHGLGKGALQKRPRPAMVTGGPPPEASGDQRASV